MIKQWLAFGLLVCSAAVMAGESIKRAIVTSQVEQREPVDDLQAVPEELTKVFFFTEVIGYADQFITHKWSLNGELQAEVVLRVGSDRWRTYSSKNLLPQLHTGTWQVEVVDQQNKVLASKSFTY